jgi:hypothetical protein
MVAPVIVVQYKMINMVERNLFTKCKCKDNFEKINRQVLKKRKRKDHNFLFA